jgi:hypothetical protein
MRVFGVGGRGQGREFAVLSQRLCVVTEDNHDRAQSEQTVSRGVVVVSTVVVLIKG